MHTDDPYEDLAYLARSQLRVQLLERLVSESRSRAELQEEIDISHVTLGRTLCAFEKRGWIRRYTHTYEATILGEMVHDSLKESLDTIATTQRFREVLPHFQTMAADVDLRHFTDARLTRATWADPVAPSRRIAGAFRTADTVRALVHAVDPLVLDAHWERIGQSDLKTTIVLSADAIDVIDQYPEHRRWRQDALDTGVPVRRYEDTIPFNLLLVDETVFLTVNRREGGQPVVVECVAEKAREWAKRTFERYENEATPLAVDTDVRVSEEAIV